MKTKYNDNDQIKIFYDMLDGEADRRQGTH